MLKVWLHSVEAATKVDPSRDLTLIEQQAQSNQDLDILLDRIKHPEGETDKVQRIGAEQ